MKKLFMLVAMAAMVSTVSAQKLGIWYGFGFNHITGNKSNSSLVSFESKTNFNALNIGVNYTQDLGSDFDLVGGLSYRQKGTKYNLNVNSAAWQYDGNANWKPGYIQLDILGAYNFIKNDEVKFGIQTGPYCALMVSKDKNNDGYAALAKIEGFDAEYNTFDFGWQAGLAVNYLGATLSAGYEFGFIKVYKEAETKCKNSGVYVKIGYDFDL